MEDGYSEIQKRNKKLQVAIKHLKMYTDIQNVHRYMFLYYFLMDIGVFRFSASPYVNFGNLCLAMNFSRH